MHDAHATSSSSAGTGIVLGTLAALVLGAVVGMLSSLVAWTYPESVSGFSGFLWTVFAGLLVGGLPGLIIGGTLAWHAAGVAELSEQASAAPIWGIISGIVVGTSLGPVFCGLMGMAVGQGLNGLLLGLMLGPLVGIVGWEVGYLTAR